MDRPIDLEIERITVPYPLRFVRQLREQDAAARQTIPKVGTEARRRIALAGRFGSWREELTGVPSVPQ
jgi:hypothetical protein